DALFDVNLMAEIHEVGQVVDPRPRQVDVVAEAGPDRLEDRCIRPDLAVTVHARLGRRNAGKRRLLDRGMAIAAVDADAAHVVGMAELLGLLDDFVLLGGPAGPEEREDHEKRAQDETECPSRAHAGDGGGTGGEDLAHRRLRKTPSAHIGCVVWYTPPGQPAGSAHTRSGRYRWEGKTRGTPRNGPSGEPPFIM